MDHPQKVLKPLLTFSVDIKSIHFYRDFLKKRLKKSLYMKFSMIRSQLPQLPTDGKRTQMKLLKMLKIAKPAVKVNLKEFKITTGSQFLEAVFKKISYIKTLSLSSHKNDSQVKYFKCLTRLQRLNYQLDGNYIVGYRYHVPSQQTTEKDPLKYLKYCPKIRALEAADRTNDCSFPNLGIESKRYLRSLKRLDLVSKGWGQMKFDFPIDFCENLRSISFKFYDADFPKSIAKFMNTLPGLPYLQEIDLSVRQNPSFDLIEIFQLMAKRETLQKVSLELGSGILKLEKLLATLRICKLKSFSLKVHFQKGLLNSISKFISSKNSLGSLGLHIISRNFFLESDNIIEICKQINKLPALRNLKLNFETLEEISESARISNFIPYLHDLFRKSIKIEVLHLECNQLDHSEALQSLMSILENSACFLTHLKINFEALPCTRKTYQSFLNLMRNLSNIQALDLPCLEIGRPASQFLSEMVQVLYAYKYLRVFIMGEMTETATVSVFEKTVEAVASKRGLRQFRFSMSESFQKKLLKESKIEYPKMKRIRKKNPQLDTVDFEENFSSLSEF